MKHLTSTIAVSVFGLSVLLSYFFSSPVLADVIMVGVICTYPLLSLYFLEKDGSEVEVAQQVVLVLPTVLGIILLYNADFNIIGGFLFSFHSVFLSRELGEKKGRIPVIFALSFSMSAAILFAFTDWISTLMMVNIFSGITVVLAITKAIYALQSPKSI